MVYKYNGAYYILVSSNRLSKVLAVPANKGVSFEPTGEDIHIEDSVDTKKYQPTTTEEIIKDLYSVKKEVIKPKEDFGSRLIKPKNKN